MSVRLFPRAAFRPIVAAAVLLAACGDGAGPSGSTALSIKLKDALGDVQHAVVTIAEVNLMGSGGKLVLRSEPFTTDLLTLAATAADLVSDAEVPSGKYTELRFVITGACLAVENESGGSDIHATAGYDATPCGGPATGTLQTPSYAQSGLKVTLDAGALEITGAQKILVVDFDVSQSFGQVAGSSGQWAMHPVITGGDISSTGSVQATVQLGDGVTLPTVGGSPVTLDQLSAVLVAGASDTVAVVPLADADQDGVFTADFLYVTPGSFTLSLAWPDGVQSVTTAPATPMAVTVASGQQLTAALTVTAAD